MAGAKSEKFDIFKAKLQKQVQEDAYISESNHSDIEHEDTEAQIDQKFEREDEHKQAKSEELQKEGLISMRKIIEKP